MNTVKGESFPKNHTAWIVKNVRQVDVYKPEGVHTILPPTYNYFRNYCLIAYHDTSRLEDEKGLKFKKKILQHILHVDSVEELADACSCNLRTFTRRFKKYFGTTPYQWILHRKKATISHYLKNTQYSMNELTEIFGFSSKANFRAFCRNLFGVCPSKMRKET